MWRGLRGGECGGGGARAGGIGLKGLSAGVGRGGGGGSPTPPTKKRMRLKTPKKRFPPPSPALPSLSLRENTKISSTHASAANQNLKSQQPIHASPTLGDSLDMRIMSGSMRAITASDTGGLAFLRK